jgi:hypothetical protein
MIQNDRAVGWGREVVIAVFQILSFGFKTVRQAVEGAFVRVKANAKSEKIE